MARIGRALRALWWRLSTRVYRPGDDLRHPSAIGDERILIGGMPIPETLGELRAAGITHVVNCRARLQHAVSGDLGVERDAFGAAHVATAPMWDHGRRQSPASFASAARFVSAVLDADPGARVLVHCQKGRRRSVLVGYAALRLRGRSPEDAARLLLAHRPQAELVPAYRQSVEDWLAAEAPAAGAA